MLAELIQASINSILLTLHDTDQNATAKAKSIAHELNHQANSTYGFFAKIHEPNRYALLHIPLVDRQNTKIRWNLEFFRAVAQEVFAKTHKAMHAMAQNSNRHNLDLNPIYQGLKLLHDSIQDTHSYITQSTPIPIQHRKAQHALLKVNMIGFADVPAHQAAKTSINLGDSGHINTVIEDLTEIKDVVQQLLSDSHNALRNYAENPGDMDTAQATQVQHLATAFAKIKSLVVQSPLQYYMHTNDSLFHIKLNPEEFNKPGAILTMTELFDHAYKSLRDCIDGMPIRGYVPDAINALLGEVKNAIGDIGSNFRNLELGKTPDDIQKYLTKREEKIPSLKQGV